MIDTYFSARKTLRRLRSGLAGPHIDSFARALQQQRYSRLVAVCYVRAASHLGSFVQRRGLTLADINPETLEAFGRHLFHCQCYQLHSHRRTGYHARFGAKLFHQYLIQLGVCSKTQAVSVYEEPGVVNAFRDWYRTHRGATEPTLRLYCRGATEVLHGLGEDIGNWTPSLVREFLLERAQKCGAETTQKLITSLRAFFRYLSFCGKARIDLDLAIPAIAHWRLATLPRCLSAEELERLISACNGDSLARLRDRAIVLILSRLGVRAGDVARLRFTDIDWKSGTLQVTGKSRYQVRLPLPQDLGDALLGYLQRRPRWEPGDRIFLRVIAPCKPFTSGCGVSNVVKRALRRARIQSPACGAHLLRHTAATEMLRHGVPLDQVGLVLRHRSIDVTAYYAKVDFNLLQQIAQPWPEVKP
jgi:site-specific recombinase XerD